MTHPVTPDTGNMGEINCREFETVISSRIQTSITLTNGPAACHLTTLPQVITVGNKHIHPSYGSCTDTLRQNTYEWCDELRTHAQLHKLFVLLVEGSTPAHPVLGREGNIRQLVNILFMAPRMVYFSMIYLLWSIFVEASTTFQPVVYGP